MQTIVVFIVRHNSVLKNNQYKRRSFNGCILFSYHSWRNDLHLVDFKKQHLKVATFGFLAVEVHFQIFTSSVRSVVAY